MGSACCLIGIEYPVQVALRAAEQLASEGQSVGVVDFFGLKTFAPEALVELLTQYHRVVSIEEAFVGKGGLDWLLLYFANQRGLSVRIKPLGLAENYKFEIARRDELHEQRGLGAFPNLSSRQRIVMQSRDGGFLYDQKEAVFSTPRFSLKKIPYS